MSSNFSSTQLGTALVLSATSLAVGFLVGRLSQPPKVNPDLGSPDDPPTQDTEVEPGSEEEVEEISDGDLAAIKAGITEPCKLVLVVRSDLKMTPGKIAAQCGHATLACFKALVEKNPSLVKHWERTGQAKIALKGTSEEELLELLAIAKSLNLCARVIQDAGHTQVDEGTRTVLGIGPAPVSLINQVTGHLRLL